MAVLDIGGGTGRVSARLATLGADVTVFDVSPSMLARARARGLPAGIALAESLPLRADCMDRVVVVDAFHHFADQRWAATELVRVLRSGGRLVVEEPDARRLAVTLLAWGEKLARMQTRILPPDDIARLFEAAGGRVAAITPDGWSVHMVVTK
jgi:ubiquinone/menaquinone biosynthesis C-methylase UbiE